MSRSRILAWALGLVAACGPTLEPQPEIPTLEVERTEAFVRRISAEGYLRAVEATSINAPEDSKRPMKIAWVAVDGSAVQEGEVVLRFDAIDLQRELADSQDDVTSAQRQIDKERALGGSSARRRDRTAGLAAVELDMARELHSEDQRILSRNEIIETSIDAELAQAKAEHAREVKAVEGAVSRSQREVHDITRKQAQREVERAEEGLARLEITAPHAGLLVLERDWRGQTLRVGDTIWRGQKVAEIPLVSAMEAEVFVLEADAGDVAEGLPAELVIEAHPEHVIEAKVARVDTLAKPIHQEVPVQYFAVTLALSQTDSATMKIGQRVRATIVLDQGAALVVPRQAVFERDGRLFVHREGALGGFSEVEVKLGPSSAGRVVIAEGLEEGDRIALRDPNAPAAGADAKADDAPSNGGAKGGAEGGASP
ncbi:efflux RND transporter periplasmic adaptor subunit [Paraliomyxa miuraensis]|uniref:efflux RND transporter periplasmic adaptor subunit n=1 Tax=Paraliomyxa miuraensis TaxID=376150 RepID=UPI00225554A4|nr:HlyD family efflux transporter periplasmic adaptor subunit [Paraliomyxa miuraensis]MCX4246234.1 HlyD family efflux transporter periplasmic adaptor subunit [Paraliomyxa miuraensis]